LFDELINVRYMERFLEATQAHNVFDINSRRLLRIGILYGLFQEHVHHALHVSIIALWLILFGAAFLETFVLVFDTTFFVAILEKSYG